MLASPVRALRRTTRLLTLAVAAAATAMFAGSLPVQGAVLPAPTPPHNIFTLPMQDAITTIQSPNTAVSVTVLRGGVVVGTASGTTDATGLLQVNHPGGVCFTGFTPLLMPQDVVQVTTATSAEQSVIQNITAEPQINNLGVIEVHGTAADAAGAPLPIGVLDVRLISKTLFALNGRRDLRAGIGAAIGSSLTYDTPGGIAFTAKWAGLSAGDIQLALGASTRADWLGVNPLLLNEATVFDVGFVPGPLAQCLATAPAASYAVASSSVPVVNAGNAAGGLVLSGLSTDATSVSVTLDDTNAATPAVTVPATLSAPAGGQSWTAPVTGAQLTGLSDGTLTASGSYVTAAGTITGKTLTITKDTAAPAAPVAAPAGGVYHTATSATLTDADPTAVIHGTTDGTVPSATSPVLGTTVLAPGTTTIRARAVDPAGNVSPETSTTYTLLSGLDLSPATLDAGSALVGGAPGTSTVTVTNITSTPVHVGTVSVQGPDANVFSITGCTGVTLISQGSCTVHVTFTPTKAAPVSATIVVADDALASPHLVTLLATGKPGFATPVLGASAMDFGTLRGGDKPVEQTTTLSNTGNLPMTVRDASLSGSPSFALTGNTCGPLAPGASCTFTVRYDPVSNGPSTSNLIVRTDAAGATLQLPISGTSVQAAYWLLNSDGGVYGFGSAATLGSAPSMPGDPAVALSSTPGGAGYWVVTSTGRVFAFGNAPNLGQLSGGPLNKPIVGMAATPTGKGFWLVATDGGIFAFGDATFYGSTGSILLNKPIVGMSTTPTGAGYWLVASDGGIFAYGDAAFRGSTGSFVLNKPIVGMTTTVGGAGYWLVASDGGIFAFGDAGFFGSTGAITLNQPITGMMTASGGQGYWLVARDGGLFAFGRAPFAGSAAGARAAQPFVGGIAVR